jgi:hypothetical protein
MPEQPPRRRWRRTAFATLLTAAVAAFGGSLAGIASTEGKLRPGGAAVQTEQRLQQQHAPHGCPSAHPARKSAREV